jgi:hypothetical protein
VGAGHAAIDPSRATPANASLSGAWSLDLVNGTLIPGAYPGGQGAGVGAVVFDPSLDRLFVQVSHPTGYAAGSPIPGLLEVDPAGDVVASAIPTPNCSAVSLTGLVFDPASGLLFALCQGGNALAIDPATGAVVANLSLGSTSSGAGCAGFVPTASSLLALPSLHELAALVWDCGPDSPTNNSSVLSVSLSLLDDRDFTTVTTVDFGPQPYSPSDLDQAEPMAYDNASGQLYIDALVTSGELLELSVVDPLSGAIAVQFPVDSYLEVLGLPPLFYDGAVGAVLTDGLLLPDAPVVGTAVFRIDPLSAQATPVAILGGYGDCPPGDRNLACGYQAIPGWILPAPLDGTAVTVETYAQNGGQSARVVNTSDGLEVANLSIPRPAGPGAFVPSDATLFLETATPEALAGIVGPSPRLGASVALNLFAYSGAIVPGTQTVYVAAGPDCTFLSPPPCVNATMDVISLATDSEVSSWPLPPGGPVAVAFNPWNQDLYVLTECPAGPGADQCPTESSTVVTRYSLEGEPLASAALSIVPGSEPLPGGMAVDSATGDLLVTGPVVNGHGLIGVFALDPTTLNVSFSLDLPASVATSQSGLAFDGSDNLLFASTGCVQVVGATRVLGACLYAVSATNLSVVWVLQSDRFGALGPLAYDPATGEVYAGNNSEIEALDASNGTLASSWNLSSPVYALALEPGNGLLYVADGANLSELNVSDGVVVRTDGSPNSVPTVLPDPMTGEAVLTEWGVGTVLFDPGPAPSEFPVEFVASGLPAGTPWSVEVNGSSQRGLGPLWFFLPNGTYSYRVSPVAGLAQSTLPSAGSVAVNGSAVVEPTAAYEPYTYRLTFQETGAGDPEGFSVQLVQQSGLPFAGACPTCENTGQAREFAVSNGTYAYLLEGNGSGYRLEGAVPAGVVEVTGASVTVSFGLVSGPTPWLSFRAAGTFTGSWCVELASAIESCGAGPQITFVDLSPGVYSYRVITPPGFATAHPSGAVVLGDRSTTVHGRFTEVRFAATVTAFGLAPHTRWKLEIDGKTLTGSRSALSLDLPNGTYPYVAEAVAGYTGGGAGTLTVNGAAVAVVATYAAVLFPVTFSETGLPAGTVWYLIVDGTTYRPNGTSLVVELSNGSVAFSVLSLFGYAAHPAKGHVKVAGSATSVTIGYRPT